VKSRGKWFWHCYAAFLALGLGALTLVGTLRWQVVKAINGSAQAVAAEQQLRFEVFPVTPAVTAGVEPISASADFSQAAFFQDRLYIAGPRGLDEYDERGTPLHQYRVGLDLPPSPLVHLTTGVLSDARRPELLIATAAEGVLAFDGRSFRQIRPAEPEARTITSILALASGRLLIGTLKRGLLVYDGKKLELFHPTLADVSVTGLAGDEADLWIGTLDRGVLHWQGGQWEQFDDSHGLPDARVYSLHVAGEKTYVGTAIGVAEFDHGRLTRTLAPGAFATSLYVQDGKLLVGTIDQGIVELDLHPHKIAPPLASDSIAKIGPIRQIFSADSTLYALADTSLYSQGRRGGWSRVLAPSAALLADRNVSALAVDASHRLWVGYFNRGLDLVSAAAPPGRLTADHIEDDSVFCVNRIVAGITKDVTAVATANGLVLFDSAGHRREILGKAEGLLSDHVTDVAAYDHGMAIATPAGLTFIDASGPHSLYAFHGLVNNHVYTLAVQKNQVLAGTLGGISLLDHEHVAANYTTASSGLKHNWISAAAVEGNGWIIGTYGAGIERLNPDGKFETFNIASGNFDVNPNALLVTDRHILAGSLEHGLYIQNRQSERWTVLAEGLPSHNVTALAADNGYIYIGTDNGLVRIPEQNLP
jgi:ligand-binding sensor domain-containing protein